jgi:saccharopine dehydrogenase (NAD+, L-lysine-forming)
VVDSVLIIGAGAAGSVVAKKCAMNRDVFKSIHLASRRLESCKKIQEAAVSPIDISQVDADNVPETVALIKRVKPDLVINMALPYQDLPIMDACLETGVHCARRARQAENPAARFPRRP